MAGANSNIQLSELDFNQIKQNFKTYLESQDVIKDADYEGSVLSILLDILSYNTHYNSYYLNMITNEMFLDTASKRNSVVSKAKLLGYVPKSIKSCKATIDFTLNNLTSSYLYLPKYTKFVSEDIDGSRYTFLTLTSYYKDATNNSVTIPQITLIEGEPIATRAVYSKQTNPDSKFTIPEKNVDLDTLEVMVQTSTVDGTAYTYKKGNYSITLDGTSKVYFIEETNEGYYQIYFGDGILGKALDDGNVVLLNYVVCSGISSVGANTFSIVESVPSLSPPIVVSTSAAIGGRERESISSIKYSAPKSYSAQNRAVTYQDYISALLNNDQNISFDAVNVWGGQDNDPPVFGQVFMSMKPTGGYTLTASEKEIIKNKIIRPFSVITVDPQIIDPDYVYINVVANVIYDPNKTILTLTEIQKKVKDAIFAFSNETLNTFNSTFSFPDLMYRVQFSDPSIITNECEILLQKKFLPNLEVPTTYNLDFGSALRKGILSSGISSSPSMSFYDKSGTVSVINGINIEEIPTSSGGIDKISVTNKGYGYTSIPTVTINGDGFGATARAVVVDGSIREIVIDQPGFDYTIATVTIEGGSGQLGQAYASIVGRYGKLDSYYFNSNYQKVIFDENVGTVDYQTGIVTLENFNPLNVNNPLAQLTISANPKSNIIYSSRNRILTIDPFDLSSVVVNVTAKNQ
jgi:hypothetical protein